MTRASVALCIYYFATFAVLGAFFPYFPTWLEARGITGLSMSAIVATRPIMGVVAPIGFGLLADKLGLRGSLLRIACVGALVAMGVIAASGYFGVSLGFWSLFAVVLVFVFFRVPMLMIADVAALEEKATYGRLRLWGSIGFMVLALVTGWQIDPQELAPLPLVVTAVLVVALLAALALPTRVPPPPRPVFRDARRLAASTDYLLFLLVAFLWMASHAGYNLCFSLQLRDLGGSPAFIGVCWAVGTLAEVGLMAISGWLLERISAPRLLLLGMLGVAVRWVLLGTVQSLPLLLALQPLHAITFGVMWVASLAFVKERAPAHILATGQGLYMTAISIGGGVGVLSWGPVYAQFGGATVFRLASLVAVVGCLIALLLSRSRRLTARTACRIVSS